MKTIFLNILFILLLSGCTLAPRTSKPIIFYDFGLQQSQHSTNSASQSKIKTFNFLVTDTTSPLWMDNQAIQYRLAYHNPAQAYRYANSRWIAAPAALLTQRIRYRIASDTNDNVIIDSDNAKVQYALHTELEEFTQVFDATDNSHAVIRLRANLVDRRTRLLLAQRNFSMKIDAPTADAAGGVQALTLASYQLIDNLIDWLAAELSHQQ